MVPLSARNRARSIAHRWGPVTAVAHDGPELAALAIRYDEEDLETAETFVLRLGPGRADAIDGMVGTAVGVAVSGNGTVFVLDGRGTVHAGGRRHQLAGGRAIVCHHGQVIVAGDQKLWRFDEGGDRVEPVAPLRARRLCSGAAGLLCALDDGTLVLWQGERTTPVPVQGAKGPWSAIHMDDHARILAAAGRELWAGTTEGLTPLCTAPFEVDAVATFAGRTFASSKLAGLCVVEDGGDGMEVRKLRPSVRAHTLDVRHGVMVAAGPLCFASTDDGVDFLTRDLAPFVRIADQRMPRFLQTEDPTV